MGSWNKFLEKLAEYLPFTATNMVWRAVENSSKTLLDIGCGAGRVGLVIKRHRKIFLTGCDSFAPYLDICEESKSHDKLTLCDIRELPFENKSFDVVLCKEVIEHLKKNEAFELIKKMEDISKRKVIITTPVGKYEQHEYDNNPYQKHNSTWEPSELKKLGFTIRGVGLRGLFGESGVKTHIPHFAGPVLDVIYILVGPVVFFWPNIACHMVCQKIIRDDY